jgi:hypothetical protein
MIVPTTVQPNKWPLFYGSVLIGSEEAGSEESDDGTTEGPQKVDVIFDTGSDWLSVPTSDCIECVKSTFNVSQSNSIRLDYHIDSTAFGNTASLKGFIYED